MIGSKIANFEIIEELGAGGMGTVYKAKDLNLTRFVAIKALNNQQIKNQSNLKRFRNEAEVSAKINHPNVATLHNFLEIDDTSYIVMELVEGRTLEDLLDQKGSLSPKYATEIIIQILKGLGAAHDKGILHRDLKPANIMISEDGYVKIMDFGIALMENTTRLTTLNKVIGTINYMAPEILTGSLPSISSDLYAVGVMFYEMLSGDFMFNAESEVSLMYKIVHEKPQLAFSSGNKKLEKVVNKLITKNTYRRYPDTTQVITALSSLNLSKNASFQHTTNPKGEGRNTNTFLLLAREFFSNSNEKSPHRVVNRKLLLSILVFSMIAIVVLGATLQIGSKKDKFRSQITSIDNDEYSNEKLNQKKSIPIKSESEYYDTRSENDSIDEYRASEIPLTEKKPFTLIQKPKRDVEHSSPSETKPTTILPIESTNKGEEATKIAEIKNKTHENIPVETDLIISVKGQSEEKNTSKPVESKPVELILEQKINKTIRLRKQNISLQFVQDISSEVYEEGGMIILQTLDDIASEGIVIIPKGSPVRAMVKRKKISNSGKVTFGIIFLSVQAINGEWLDLKYPEYTDIQKDKVVFRKGTTINKVTLTSTKISIKI